MSTHGCLATSFSAKPDCCDRMTDPRSHNATDDYYYPEDAYYYVKTADD